MPRSRFLLAPALLAACSTGDGDGAARLSNYASRLARPLDTVIEVETPTPPPTAPRAAALQIAIEGGDLGGLDFLRLRGCALQTTVARRNSSLGRVAPASQRLLLDLAFLRDAPACIETLREEGREELADTLRSALEQKKRQLPMAVFNATLGNREYRDFWRADAKLGPYPEGTGSEVITALESVTASAKRWLGGDYAADDAVLELALGAIALGDGGELLRALALQDAWLRAANAAIEDRVARGPLCAADRRPRAAPILRTVVQKFFLADVQAWSADLNQRYHQLVGPLVELENLLAAALPRAYRDFREARDALIDRGRGAPAAHVRRLQKLLGPCYAEFARDNPSPANETRSADDPRD